MQQQNLTLLARPKKFGITKRVLPNGVHEATHVDHADKFKRWHRRIKGGNRLYAVDADIIEYRRNDDGSLRLAAYFEITHVPNFKTPKQAEKYLGQVIDRFNSEMKGRAVRLVAERLDVPTYFVAYESSLKHFWLYNLSASFQYEGEQWRRLNGSEMETFIANL